MLTQNVREAVRKACSGRLHLEIYYAKGSGERKRYELVPVSTRVKGDATMLYGYDIAEAKTKAFRIDRIVEATPMPGKPWPTDIKEKVGYDLELETSDKPVPKEAGIKLKPASSQ